jgi:hypothetical protein
MSWAIVSTVLSAVVILGTVIGAFYRLGKQISNLRKDNEVLKVTMEKYEVELGKLEERFKEKLEDQEKDYDYKISTLGTALNTANELWRDFVKEVRLELKRKASETTMYKIKDGLDKKFDKLEDKMSDLSTSVLSLVGEIRTQNSSVIDLVGEIRNQNQNK